MTASPERCRPTGKSLSMVRTSVNGVISHSPRSLTVTPAVTGPSMRAKVSPRGCRGNEKHTLGRNQTVCVNASRDEQMFKLTTNETPWWTREVEAYRWESSFPT
ncbi:hypothetical protein EYF80_003881 [Liparis tanakae]|uniref:Uncharacterized protein n=1 Tax=Liparis tanakae TaxID=230148 RepID=A0A4Z2J7N5_9TELE|nr:hypothetical protein EYF80_003881 [Liparis tanakae]